MDWTRAIEMHRSALLAVVAAIVALIGGRPSTGSGWGAGLIARSLRNAALALLRPAEAAARRLIVISARGLVVRLPPPRPMGERPVRGDRVPAFPLVEPTPPGPRLGRPLPRLNPRIRTFWNPQPVLPAPHPATRPVAGPLVESAPLRRRLAALEAVLADLPKQARRLARWRARRVGTPLGGPHAPLRFGRPPGSRKRPRHAIDDVLRDCHALALEALAVPALRPDTS
jgi:hypothetical protein